MFLEWPTTNTKAKSTRNSSWKPSSNSGPILMSPSSTKCSMPSIPHSMDSFLKISFKNSHWLTEEEQIQKSWGDFRKKRWVNWEDWLSESIIRYKFLWVNLMTPSKLLNLDQSWRIWGWAITKRCWCLRLSILPNKEKSSTRFFLLWWAISSLKVKNSNRMKNMRRESRIYVFSGEKETWTLLTYSRKQM